MSVISGSKDKSDLKVACVPARAFSTADSIDNLGEVLGFDVDPIRRSCLFSEVRTVIIDLEMDQSLMTVETHPEQFESLRFISLGCYRRRLWKLFVFSGVCRYACCRYESN